MNGRNDRLQTWVASIPADFGRTDPHVHYRIWAPVIGLQLIGAATSGSLGAVRGILLFLTGLASWTLLEYVLHRFSFHSTSEHPLLRPFNSGLHLLHHQDPSSELYVAAPVLLCVPTYLAALALFRLAGGSWPVALALGSGLMTGFLLYETVHYRAHLRPARTRLMKHLKKHHMLHHFSDSTRRFGVTSPAWDCVFGTLRLSQGRSRSGTRRTA